MLSKIILGAAASVTALVVMPASAEAQGYYRDGYNGNSYRGDYAYRDRGRRYNGYDGYRGQRRYRPGDYYGRSYGQGYGRGYYGRNRYRRGHCGNGTTGAIVGGAAGALLGREVARDGRRYRRGGDGAVGAILGGAVGALVGREIGRDC